MNFSFLMKKKSSASTAPERARKEHPGRNSVSIPGNRQCLDTPQLEQLERAFREWAEDSPRIDVRLSRRRILLVFLLIRYTGAKLSEVLGLNLLEDVDAGNRLVIFRGKNGTSEASQREVHISEQLSAEIASDLVRCREHGVLTTVLAVDPGFVRRKFYERALACGFPKRLGGPEMIRKARAVELMQASLPLTAVQWMLGHSTPNLTSAYVPFSPEDIQQLTKRFVERESSRKTSARNAFFGKIRTIRKGDIQSVVELTTISGQSVTTIITRDSLERLGLKEGRLITAEVKAPWLVLQRGDEEPSCSAENRFPGVVLRLNRGDVNTECSVRISDGTELCALMSSMSCQRLDLKEGDPVWALFSCFAVVLHLD